MRIEHGTGHEGRERQWLLRYRRPIRASRAGPETVALLAPSLVRGGAETVVCELAIALRDSQHYQPVVYAAYSGGSLATALTEAAIPVRVLRDLEPSKAVLRRILRFSGTRRHDWYARAPQGSSPRNTLSTTWFRFAADVVALPRLVRAIRTDSVRVVHAHSTSLASLVAASRMITGIPVVLTAHNEGHARERLPERLRLLLAGRAIDAATGVSPAAGAHLAAQLGWPDGSVRVVANGLDPREMSRVGVPANKARFGIAGNLHAHKGHRLLLRAFCDVLAAHREAQLLVIGDGPERDALEDLSAELGIADAVCFLGRYEGTSDPKYLEFLSDIGTLVTCSFAEAAPLVILEAMAAGRAIVAPRIGALPQIVRDGETGILISPNDVRDLSVALVNIANDPDAGRAMGRRGRARFQAHFTAQAMAANYCDAYDDVLRTRLERP